ncbi:MAG: hypothetical protein A2X86_22255 [Bdellovibrionales bacterium GWA2_49_15]|nr:MAG: hypothetical protein A2X86_22255 [Bdellovibrionales bacterium GWA2_49_15]HAZ14798.1 hypothetical protein [Bdellovibrionales bacterium]
MKKFIALIVTGLWLSGLNQAMAVGFNISIGDKPKNEKLSPAELNKHVETLKALKDSAPAQAFDKLTPEQTEKVLLTAIREGHEKIPNPLVDVLVPIAAFIFLASTFGIPLYLKNRRFKEFQTTLQMFIEKGQPIPAGLIENGMDGNRGHQDWRRGILLVAFGLGLLICLILAKSSAWGIGFIPLCLGGASIYLAKNVK